MAAFTAGHFDFMTSAYNGRTFLLAGFNIDIYRFPLASNSRSSLPVGVCLFNV